MIREVSEKDIKRINELGLLVTPNFLTTYNVLDYFNNSNYIMLTDDEVNSFLLVYKNIDTFELEMIVVGENYRNKGLATNLFNHFLKKYVTIGDVIFLEVSVLNKNAINFYKKNNFEIINTRKKYYDGVDAYVMKKVIE